MKKLLTLFTLLLTVCSGAWAQYPTYSLIDGGAINTAHFLTTGSLNDGSNNSTYSKYVKLSGNVTGTTSLASSANFIAYDVKTTKTVFTVYVYNKNNSAKNLCIHDVKEVLTDSKATATMTTKSIASKSKDADPESYTTNNTGKATIYFTSAAANDAEFYQIIASEEGDPIDNATAGYVGYSLNLNKGRIATKAAETPSYDGIEFCTSSDYKPTNNTELKLKTFGTHYVKFTTHERCALFLTRTSNIAYTLGSAKNVAGATQYGPTAGTDKIVLDGNTTYFINPVSGNTSDFKITNIAFAPVYAINFAAGTGGSGTMTTLYNYEGGKVTVPACTFTAPDGQVFDHWNVAGIDGKTEADPDEELTMPDNAITLTAVWRTPAVKHSIEYDLGDATGGTTPTQADVEEGQTFDVADAPGDLVAPSGKEFKCWNDGTNDYAPGDTYTMGTSNVTLTAQYVNIKCATPTITKGGFNFEHKGYEVTITNNEDGSTLYYSTNNVDWTEYTDVLYATTTTHYYAKSVKASYDDSDVADKNVTNSFDGEKKYIAWVYESGYKDGTNPAYDFDTDEIVIELKKYYNVVPVVKTKSTTLTASDDIGNADLIVSSEAVTGKENLAKSMKAFVGAAPMLHMKLWSYTSGRWEWASAAANPETDMITPERKTYKVLDGVAFDGDDISMFDDATGTRVQNVVWDSKPANNVDMARAGGNVAMHAIIDNDHLDKQFFAIGLSCVNNTKYSNNAKTIVKNAADMLIAGTERLDAEVATVPVTIGASGYASYCSSYALDFTETGVTAYTAKVEEEKVVLTKVTDNIVPANEGVVLRGAQDDYNIPVATTDDSFDFSENQMVGVVQRTQVVWNVGGKYNYILQQGQFNMANGGYLKANRAYLSTTYNVEAQGGAKPLTIVFNDEEQGEETDGIKSVQGSEFTVNGEAYNLSGQRVGADYKGLVIINGKKVIRK